MTRTLLEELTTIVDVLNEQGLEYALCGGMAVAVHGHVRATKDIDLLIPRSELEAILKALDAIDFDIVAGPIPFAVGTARERRLYRASRVGGSDVVTVDLLLVTPVFEDVWADRQWFEWHERRLPVVSLGGLTKMKLMAGRHQDLADLENLRVIIDDEED